MKVLLRINTTHIHKPLCSEDMCFPQQQLVLH